MAQRWPSTDTSLWMDVPLGHHVEKKAKLPSAAYVVVALPAGRPRRFYRVYRSCRDAELAGCARSAIRRWSGISMIFT